jgi:hypothetical protein
MSEQIDYQAFRNEIVHKTFGSLSLKIASYRESLGVVGKKYCINMVGVRQTGPRSWGELAGTRNNRRFMVRSSQRTIVLLNTTTGFGILVPS